MAREVDATPPESAFHETETPVDDIVRDWTGRSPEARARTLIITQLNADRQAVNAGIHRQLHKRGELGNTAITVPVLDKITHTRHEFNKTQAWTAGMVVKRGDRYQDVLAVDRNGNTVTVRDEEGKIGLYSPRELITGDVQLFKRNQIEVRQGDLLRFTATDREQGQTANHRFTVESVSEKGDIRLRGGKGMVTINPDNVRAQQHLDYAWAVTGYGAQATSTDYVISLEGTDEGRKAMATRRAFYISASRAKEHVQIYTDGKADWTKAVTRPERDIKTAHDALHPETQRQQAKAIWAMGLPVSKTAIGRAWVRHQGMQDTSLTAKIIPATRRFPEPALALPVYDNNGKSAGLALVSLVSSPEGRLTQGDTRMVMTERARGAVLQRSQSGHTHVVSDLGAALEAVKANPKDGVVWQAGEESPSSHLLKVTGGERQDAEERVAINVSRRETDIALPETEKQKPEQAMSADTENAREQEALRRISEEALAVKAGKEANLIAGQQEEKVVLPEDYTLKMKPEFFRTEALPESNEPDRLTLRNIAGSEDTAASEAVRRHSEKAEIVQDRTPEERAGASRVVSELANSERDIVRQPDTAEHGRMPERDEPALTRTPQKER